MIASAVACWTGGARTAEAASSNINTNTNVTTVVHDMDAAGNKLLTMSDDFNGVGQATYTTVPGNGPSSNQISSWIQSAGGWKLNLFNQSVRTLFVTPNDAINSSQPVGPASGYYWQNLEAYSTCYDQSNNVVAFPSLVNGSGNCSLGVDFTYGGTKYKLVMSPVLPSQGPVTGRAQVVCNSTSNNQCDNWTIIPNTAAAYANVANLYKYVTKGLAFIGQYYNTFRIDVTNP